MPACYLHAGQNEATGLAGYASPVVPVCPEGREPCVTYGMFAVLQVVNVAPALSAAGMRTVTALLRQSTLGV